MKHPNGIRIERYGSKKINIIILEKQTKNTKAIYGYEMESTVKQPATEAAAAASAATTTVHIY